VDYGAVDEGSDGDTASATTMEARFTDLCKVQALDVEPFEKPSGQFLGLIVMSH
jgi:hypothetical protein